MMKKLFLMIFLALPISVFAEDEGALINSNLAKPVDSSTVNTDAVSLKKEAHSKAVSLAKNTGGSVAPSAPDASDPDYWQTHNNYDKPVNMHEKEEMPGSSSLPAEKISALQGMLAVWNKPAIPSKEVIKTEGSLKKGGVNVEGREEASLVATALPGDIWYATLTLGADSYVNGPVMAAIQSGPYKGGTVLGQFQIADDGTHLILSFTQLSSENETMPINAFAMPVDAKLPALTGDIDHHFFARYLLPLAIDFVAGAPDMFNTTGQKVIMNDNTTVVGSPTLSSAQKGLYMAGYAANKFSSQLQPTGVRTLPEVKIAPGTGFGLVLMSPITE